MPAKSIVKIGHSALNVVSSKVEDFNSVETKQVVNDLIESINEDTQRVIGISAPQIGVNYRIFVTKIAPANHRSNIDPDELRVYINPEILFMSDEKNLIFEACSSVVNCNLLGPVWRPKHIKIMAQDISGKYFTLECDGLLARSILHEYDHLDGILFIDRVESLKKMIDREFYSVVHEQMPELQKNKIISIKEFNMV